MRGGRARTLAYRDHLVDVVLSQERKFGVGSDRAARAVDILADFEEVNANQISGELSEQSWLSWYDGKKGRS